MNTGENEQGLRAITDLIRKVSICLLVLHFYFFCYQAFDGWHLTAPIIRRLLLNFGRTGLFSHFHYTKLFSLGLLTLSLVGTKGKKEEKILPLTIIVFIVSGLLFFFGSILLFYTSLDQETIAIAYIATTVAGFLLYLTGGARLSRLIKIKMRKDIFNEENETFPQEENLVENENSVNLPAVYRFKGKLRKMWINIINGARMVLIIGSPGAGKTFFLVREIIKQSIEGKNKQFSMLVYDFKYDDLGKIAYNSFLKAKHLYPGKPAFYIINFDNPVHRCNPLEPSSMRDITDATESARTILLGLNMEWIKKTGDFFVESPINFLTCIIWFLRQYKGGIYCTLPHAIELANMDYNDLFPVLSAGPPECESLLNPFISAYLNRAMEQLEGQIASAKIALARLTSPLLYYVMGASDFTLDLNNPKEPKIVVLANNPEKTQTYGAVISLYLNRVFRILPKKDMRKCCIVADEFSSLFANGIENFLAISRGYKIFCYLAIQNIAQLRKSYGREQADVIWNLAGNILCGQATGDTAKAVSEVIGKIVQERESVSINRQDTSVSRSTQLDYAVPASRISMLSAGEFCGVLADNPDQPLRHKAFHCRIQNDPAAINAEEREYRKLPDNPDLTPLEIQNNFIRIKNQVVDIIETELERIKNDPDLAHLIFVKGDEKKEG